MQGLIEDGSMNTNPTAIRLWEKKAVENISDDELLDNLDDQDFDFGPFRERRMEELKQEMEKLKSLQDGDRGKYSELTDEKEVIQASASEDRCVIHFAHRDFRRCQIMDQHLQTIAQKYLSTRFIKVYVENAPWLVTKLSVKVLPCVICLAKGAIKARLVGFEELGNNDQFTTSALELRLKACGVVEEGFLGVHLRPQTGDQDEDDDNEFDL